jgi:hypothetical protein
LNKEKLNERVIELVIREMLIFKHYSMDSKEIKCLFQWWAKHEIRFLIVGFLACQILGIVGSQIKFFKKNYKNTYNWKIRKINICEKNWPNDLKIYHKQPFNLVELIKKNLDFEEWKELEGSFKWDELLDI